MNQRQKVKKFKHQLGIRFNRFLKEIKKNKVEFHFYWWAKVNRAIIKARFHSHLLEDLVDEDDGKKTLVDPARKIHSERAKEVLEYIDAFEKKLDKFRDGYANIKVYYGLSEKNELDFKKKYKIK